MIQLVKDMILDCLRDNEAALFMIFNAEGEILWRHGRAIQGRTVAGGTGFCRSHCLEALKKRGGIETADCLIHLGGDSISESAILLMIKRLAIFPVSDDLFFYIDSGGSERFGEMQLVKLKTLGAVFARLLESIEKNGKSNSISGTSAAADTIRALARKYAIMEDPVLLQGETGVGKNRVAKLIHGYSGRRGDFVRVHTPGVARELFESQLFGHRKGSFTGAGADAAGFVTQAEGGTLFLDEIAEIPTEVQAKLLRLIDDKTYTRVGDPAERRADVRIVAATNRELRRLIEQKLFREDLYFRLNVLPILLPPLRERRDDIPDLLAEHEGALRGKKLNQEAVEVLVNYDWPGNIRELRSILTRAGANCEAHEIGAEIGEFLEKDFPSADTTPGDRKAEALWRELKNGKTFWETVKNPFMKRDICREDVKTIIQRALKESVGHGYMKDCLPILNIPPQELKRFLDFTKDYRIL